MDTKIPIPIQNILRHYIAVLHERIPNTLEGLYIHGSIALDAYIHESSDIDFLAIINRQLTEAEVKTLSKLHQELAAKYKKTGMDGCYLLWEDMGKVDLHRRLYTNDGKVEWSEQVTNPITWWILKNKGITIIGQEIPSFDFEIDDRILLDYCLSNMNTYWLNRMKKNEKYKKFAFLLPNKIIDWEIQWSVSGMLRQFYTINEHKVISKVGACEYAINHMPQKWHGLINEAISIRKGLNVRYCDSKKQRIIDTLEFMHYILDNCNANAPRESERKDK